jgi:hypothetical protein
MDIPQSSRHSARWPPLGLHFAAILSRTVNGTPHGDVSSRKKTANCPGSRIRRTPHFKRAGRGTDKKATDSVAKEVITTDIGNAFLAQQADVMATRWCWFRRCANCCHGGSVDSVFAASFGRIRLHLCPKLQSSLRWSCPLLRFLCSLLCTT